MANKLYEESNIQNIANAIREKNGSSDKYTTSQMADAIRSINSSSGGVTYKMLDIPLETSVSVVS